LSDRMANNCSISKKTWKLMKKKLFFHLLDLTVLNSYVLYKSWGGMTHLKFREQVVRDLVFLSHEENTEIVVCQGVFPSVWRPKWADLK
jgi:hypothetical protein